VPQAPEVTLSTLSQLEDKKKRLCHQLKDVEKQVRSSNSQNSSSSSSNSMAMVAAAATPWRRLAALHSHIACSITHW
jgi:hypothetical protein